VEPDEVTCECCGRTRIPKCDSEVVDGEIVCLDCYFAYYETEEED
jgi:hypothetical protein